MDEITGCLNGDGIHSVAFRTWLSDVYFSSLLIPLLVAFLRASPARASWFLGLRACIEAIQHGRVFFCFL